MTADTDAKRGDRIRVNEGHYAGRTGTIWEPWPGSDRAMVTLYPRDDEGCGKTLSLNKSLMTLEAVRQEPGR